MKSNFGSCCFAALAACALLASPSTSDAQSGSRSSSPAYRPAPARSVQPRASQPSGGSNYRAVQPATMQPKMMDKSMAAGSGSGSREMMAKVGLDGYCPVCVIEMKKWEKGNPSIASQYDGMTYYFPSSAIKAKFDASPEKYVPVLNGDCIVCLGNMNKRVAGSVKFSALHQNRLYLFPAEQQKAMFLANPSGFEKTDIASGGNCVVCLAKMSQEVPGSMEHTVIHDGKRYLFPSEKEAGMFRQSPQQFVSATSPAGGSGSR